MNTNDIEKILRKAPQPQPPASLRNQVLAAGVAAAAGGGAKSSRGASGERGGGFSLGELRGWGRRWWSTLIPAGATVLCLGIVAAQQARIRAIEEEIHTRAAASSPASPAAGENEPPAPLRPSAPSEASLAPDQEVERLKGIVSKLEQEVAALKQARQSASAPAVTLAPGQDYLTPEEVSALTGQRDRSLRIVCVNNLKQFCLAVRIWATDNQDVFPPSIISMKNELSTPKILVCPADTGREAATSWETYTSANCSYEYLGASASANDDPNRILARCATHSNVGLFDGSVQMAKPECVVSRDGKLYLMNPATISVPATNPAATAPSPATPADEARKRFMKRYGLSEGAVPQPAPQQP